MKPTANKVSSTRMSMPKKKEHNIHWNRNMGSCCGECIKDKSYNQGQQSIIDWLPEEQWIENIITSNKLTTQQKVKAIAKRIGK